VTLAPVVDFSRFARLAMSKFNYSFFLFLFFVCLFLLFIPSSLFVDLINILCHRYGWGWIDMEIGWLVGGRDVMRPARPKMV
jgi:hypothetical protein